MYLNKTFLFGNLTRDPELKSMPNGNKVCTFSIATNRIYKDNAGQKHEEAEYHNVVVFGKQAENCGQYLKKGQTVLIEGRIQTRSWDDKTSGEKKYKTEIIADGVQFGPKAGDSSPAPREEKPAVEGKGMTLDDIFDYGDVDPDDIPF